MTKALMILSAILMMALAVSGYLLKTAWSDLGKAEILYAVANAETEAANTALETTKILHADQLKQTKDLQSLIRNIQLNHAKAIKRIESRRASSEAAAIKYPERFGRISTYRFLVGMRSICRSGSGNAATCKITIPKPIAADPAPAS